MGYASRSPCEVSLLSAKHCLNATVNPSIVPDHVHQFDNWTASYIALFYLSTQSALYNVPYPHPFI